MLSQALRLKLPSRLFSSTISSLEKSSVPAGTALNLKIRKNGDEPVALEDSEYPEWLWECLDKEKQEQRLKEQDFMKWRKKQINKANTAKIKNNNFISQM
ncbi:39S ribosomal protein L37, mitochondrial [Clavispora lusitaniae]|nr:39S ribosomal protein L37, mitochondrial [Clavispora lusitaniae]